MMTKVKQRFIALVLAIAIAASVIVTVNIMKPVSAEASSDFMDIPLRRRSRHSHDRRRVIRRGHSGVRALHIRGVLGNLPGQ